MRDGHVVSPSPSGGACALERARSKLICCTVFWVLSFMFASCTIRAGADGGRVSWKSTAAALECMILRTELYFSSLGLVYFSDGCICGACMSRFEVESRIGLVRPLSAGRFVV